MTATQQQRSQQQTRTADRDPAKLLDQIIDSQSEKFKVVNAYLDDRVERIEAVLPDAMKGQGRRLAKRAMMTLARRPELKDCPPADFIRCVIEAAELGLAIDGKLCYVVRYKNTWQMQPDYKGLIAVAKRAGQITDAYADVVCQNDHFVARRVNNDSVLEHEYRLGQPRGEVVGAYAVLKLPGGQWRYELMDRSELDRIQKRAPAQNGPWRTDVDEMRKKTVIRRGLKTYCDDPAIVRAMELDDEGFEAEEQPERPPQPGRVNLRANGHSQQQADYPDPPPVDQFDQGPTEAEQSRSDEPPEEPAPPDRQPGDDAPDADDLARGELADDLRRRGAEATTEGEVNAVLAELAGKEEWLGALLAGQVRQVLGERVKVLAKKRR